MKSKKKQRILALILSMVLMLSASISALAQGDVQTEASGTETTENQAAAQSLGEETVPETEAPAEEAGIATQSAEITEEPVEQETADQNTAEQGTTEQNTAEQEPQTQENPEVSAQTQEASAEAAGTVQEGTSAAADNSQENISAAETAPESEVQNTETQEETSVSEEQSAETTEETVTEETVVSEAAELKQEFTDEDGNVTQTVTAYVPEGAFQATADQISMEVKLLNEEDTNYIKGMMEEKLPEDFYLDGYVLYQIDFKVNGEITKPAKAITISMTGNELAVEDTKNAHVFYYVPEDPEAEGDEDQLTEVTQKDQLIKSLEESGQSTENIEDYDYSEIAVNEGNADSITVKGWESTIYGCYVEKEMAQEVTYEDDTVKVTVSADEKGIIPNKTTLQVVPISNSGETKDQYKEVEKKLQEKAESEEYEIAGFLAYDISFVDKDGKEVEPDGEVRVSLEYKNATLPEGMTEEEAKEADVTMLHLEEDEKGKVKDVVDMAEKEQVEAIATTESQQVEKVAVKTESFSTFTIIWVNQEIEITVHYVNDKYQEITDNGVQSENIEISNSSSINLFDYAKNIEGYDFTDRATIGKSNGAESVRYVCYDNGLQYRSSQQGWWENWPATDGYHVYLIYEVSWNEDFNATIETVDNNKEHISLNLFDYKLVNGQGTETENSYYGYNQNWDNGYNRGINAGKELKFISTSRKDNFNEYVWDKNNYTGSEKVFDGILNENLSDGYPVLAGYNGQSLKYLFDPNRTSEYRTDYIGVNHLFTKDEDGYFSFDSDENYAYLQADGDFKVYSKSAGDVVSGTKTKDWGAFYPFNDLRNVIRKPWEEVGGGGYGLGADQANHYFGMVMSASFYQPKDGKINGEDMIFEFSGDDDAWVFIDGKLVLDLGGIHNAASGSINFATGEVKVNGRTVTESFYEDERFEDYSTHTIKFFYLERGNSASNCKLKFNLPTIPENSVMVTKELETEGGAAANYTEGITFDFNIQKEDDGNEEYEYEVYENNRIIKTAKTENGGNFSLEPGQSAVFSGFLANEKYEVKEIGASLAEGYDIQLSDNIEITYEDENGYPVDKDKVDGIYAAATGWIQVSERPSVTYTNKIKQTGTLNIKKVMADGSTAGQDEEFSIQLKVNGRNYSGNYSVNDTTKPAVNGTILLKAGETAQITGFPYGTSFDVKESTSGTDIPTYSVSDEGDLYELKIPGEDNTYTSVSGKISGTEGTVIVTNRKVNIGSGTTDVTVEKTWKDKNSYSDLIPEGLEVTLYEDTDSSGAYNEADQEVTQDVNGEEIQSTVSLSKKENWKHTWYDLSPEKKYFVVETLPDGFQQVGETQYTKSIGDLTYIDYLERCIGVSFNIGKNNALLIQKNDESYAFWTYENLELSSESISQILEAVDTENAPDNIDWNLENISYISGAETSGITAVKGENGYTLTFDNTIAKIWSFSYTETNKATIVNTIDTNSKTSLKVQKEWEQDAYIEGYEVKVQLVQDGKPVSDQVVTLGEGNWTHTFGDLDRYYKDTDEKWKEHIYSVEEIAVGTDEDFKDPNYNGMKGYEAEITTKSDGTVLITNKLATVELDLQKYGTNYETGQLNGAEFSLYKGEKGNDGQITWTDDSPVQSEIKVTSSQNELQIEPGYYYLVETKAPAGYQLLEDKIYFQVSIDGFTLIKENGDTIAGDDLSDMMWKVSDTDTKVLMIRNQTLYSLPSAGGPGIFLYMIGGTLLLMAGSLMIYINRRRGVLRK